MDTTRLDFLIAALQRFEESLNLLPDYLNSHIYLQIRDSVIQRFEFSVDLFWKCLKDHLEERHGVIAASPKAIFREAFAHHVITKTQHAGLIKMIDDRNDTSHRYDEVMAERVARSAESYHGLMIAVLKRFTDDVV